MNDQTKILVLTDDYARQTRLSTYGLKVGQSIERATPDNFAELLSSRAFRLIVVDSQQRDAYILRLCSEVRSLTKQPILLLTYNSEENFQLRAYEAGVQECVLRPIGSKLLEAKVEAWLRWTVSEPELAPYPEPEKSRVKIGNGASEIREP